MVVRIDVPSAALFSTERRDIMQLLHEIVAHVEMMAVREGFKAAKALAGGSCKKIFCYEYALCRKLSEQGPCRHPEMARPSMSGFGIDVAKLFRSAQWDMDIAAPGDTAADGSMSWVAGIILMIGSVDPAPV